MKYYLKKRIDRNGNSELVFKREGFRSFAIQTVCNLRLASRTLPHEVEANKEALFKELKEWVDEHGTDYQKKAVTP